MSWEQFDEIFGFNCGAPESLADEDLAAVVEITINLPVTSAYKSLSYDEKVKYLTNIWDLLIFDQIAKCKSLQRHYTIEQTKIGYPHIHGYICYEGLPPHSPEGLMTDIARYLYLQLPRCYWRHFVNRVYNPWIENLKARAICLNYKGKLDDSWVEYINKEADKNAADN